MDEGKVVLTTREYMDLVERASAYQSIIKEFAMQVADNAMIHDRVCKLENRVCELERSKKL